MDYKDALALGKNKYWWFTAKDELIGIFLRRYFSHKGLYLLLGSGVSHIPQLGDKLILLDIDPKPLLLVTTQHSRIVGDAMQLPFHDNTLSGIIAMDILEHLEEDTRCVQEMKRVLKPGGVALVSVPYGPSIFSSHDLALGHKRRYTKQQLLSLFSAWEVITTTSWNMLFYYPIALLRHFQKKQAKIDIRPLPSVINQICLTLLRLENGLIAKGFSLPFGLSYLCVVKKT